MRTSRARGRGGDLRDGRGGRRGRGGSLGRAGTHDRRRGRGETQRGSHAAQAAEHAAARRSDVPGDANGGSVAVVVHDDSSIVSDEAVSGTTSRPMASLGADVDRARAMTTRAGARQPGWIEAADRRGSRGRDAVAHARADVIVGPSLARSARWVECEGEAYPQRCEATILNSSSSLTSLNEKTAAAQRLMCGYLQMVDIVVEINWQVQAPPALSAS